MSLQDGREVRATNLTRPLPCGRRSVAVVAGRTVLNASGPGRLAWLTGVLRHGNDDGSLVFESGNDRIPVVVLATHTVLESPALLADEAGT